MRAINLEVMRKSLIRVIKNDKRNGLRGIIRYELLQDLSGDINCIDSDMLDLHMNGFSKQGFKKLKEIEKNLEGIDMKLVVMRHFDSNKNFEQYDGLLTGYLKADCELCFYEVDLDKINIVNKPVTPKKGFGSNVTPKKKKRK